MTIASTENANGKIVFYFKFKSGLKTKAFSQILITFDLLNPRPNVPTL